MPTMRRLWPPAARSSVRVCFRLLIAWLSPAQLETFWMLVRLPHASGSLAPMSMVTNQVCPRCAVRKAVAAASWDPWP